MSVRRQIIAALSAGSVSGIAPLYDVDHATRLVDAHAAEVRAETRSEALHEAAAEAESLIRLFPQDTDWGSAIAGALEGLAFRLRRKGGEKATPTGATATPDTLAAWLRQRFTASSVSWDNLDDTERNYWEHQALAVRRAVARGGFRTPTPEAGAS